MHTCSTSFYINVPPKAVSRQLFFRFFPSHPNFLRSFAGSPMHLNSLVIKKRRERNDRSNWSLLGRRPDLVHAKIHPSPGVCQGLGVCRKYPRRAECPLELQCECPKAHRLVKLLQENMKLFTNI